MNYNPESCVGFVVIFCFLFFLYYVLLYFLISLVSFLSWRDVILFFLKEHFFLYMYPLNLLFCDDPSPYVHSILRLILLNQHRF